MATNSFKVNQSLSLTPNATPSTPTAGNVYYDISGNIVEYYNGTTWLSLASLTGTETFTNKTISTNGTNLIGSTTISGTTGTGNIVFSALPTLSGTIGGALTFSGDLTLSGAGTGLTVDNDTTVSGLLSVGSGFSLIEISTPSNPSAGSDKLYFKSDGNLYKLNSSGVETQVDAASAIIPTPVIRTSVTGNLGSGTFYPSVVFIISSLNSANAGATYTNNGVTFTVIETRLLGTVNLLITYKTVAGIPTTGNLVKTGGTGDATIPFSSFNNTPSSLRVRMVGGGGGGGGGSQGSGANGSNGTNTGFGGNTVGAGLGGLGWASTGGAITGGAGGTNTAAAGTILVNVAGAHGDGGSSIGGSSPAGGNGGNSFFGGAGGGGTYNDSGNTSASQNTGSGGGGGGTNGGTSSGGGGGSGGYMEFMFFPGSGASYAYALGGGGGGGGGANAAGAGANGNIIVEEHYGE